MSDSDMLIGGNAGETPEQTAYLSVMHDTYKVYAQATGRNKLVPTEPFQAGFSAAWSFLRAAAIAGAISK
jgi:hypothetical protein